ncbi:MAG: hypothetical protein IPM61_08570 [Chlorobi bacterium]|nr:hypothetical protein [Chlorobiota bacterium]
MFPEKKSLSVLISPLLARFFAEQFLLHRSERHAGITCALLSCCGLGSGGIGSGNLAVAGATA